ncbi:MAG: GNAT family N-acetyltransferase [Persicimonas sp.]
MTNKPSIRRLRPDDLDALYRIRQIAFRDNISLSNPDVQQMHLDTLPYKYGRFVDGQLVSSASWYPFSMYMGGKRQTVGGLASVVSAAATRRRGHVRALLVHGLQMLCEDGLSWCLEYPFDTRYYRRYGWETVSNGCFVEVPIERFSRFSPPREAAPVDATRVDADDPTAMEHVERVYRSWAASYNFTMTRDGAVRDDWTRVLVGEPWEDGEPRFLFVTEHAYAAIMIDGPGDGERLVVCDYAFESPRGRVEIFDFLNNFAGQVDTVRLQLPSDDPLVMEWSNFMVPHPHPLHARIVDAAGALTGWPAEDDLEFTVAVSDDVCAWNNATFRIEVAGGLTRASRVEEPPAVSVDVRGLAQILSGSVTAEAASRVGLASGAPEAVGALCGLSRRPCHMSLADYF